MGWRCLTIAMLEKDLHRGGYQPRLHFACPMDYGDTLKAAWSCLTGRKGLNFLLICSMGSKPRVLQVYSNVEWASGFAFHGLKI